MNTTSKLGRALMQSPSTNSLFFDYYMHHSNARCVYSNYRKANEYLTPSWYMPDDEHVGPLQGVAVYEKASVMTAQPRQVQGKLSPLISSCLSSQRALVTFLSAHVVFGIGFSCIPSCVSLKDNQQTNRQLNTHCCCCWFIWFRCLVTPSSLQESALCSAIP